MRNNDNLLVNKVSNLGKKPISKNSIKSNNYIDIISDLNECKSLKADTSQSGSQSPSSFTNPTSPVVKHSGFLQNFSMKTLPVSDKLHLKFSQINVKSQRFIKMTNDLKNKIELLEEIYSGPEYKKFKVKNKHIQCNINIDTPQRIVLNLISKLQPNSDICHGRSIHPAYSNEGPDDSDIVTDSSTIFKVPSSYHNPLSPTFLPLIADTSDSFLSDCHDVNYDQSSSTTTAATSTAAADESIFLEHDGNTYVRVDEINYHLIQSISQDGVITTETGMQLMVPDGTKLPQLESRRLEDMMVMQEEESVADMMMGGMDIVADRGGATGRQQQQQQHHHHQQQQMSSGSSSQKRHHSGGGKKNSNHNNNNSHSNNGNSSNDSGNNNNKLLHDDGSGAGSQLAANYTYQTSNPAKPFSDYVGLPPRPPPYMPFTLSSQLYTPELAIGLTDRDCELMLTIDCSKKAQPQQPSLYYQIYSYKDEDRYSKPTSEVWGLVGEIRACPLPMFCTISIPSGVHKHYFSIRSVDEFNRFSDWSNVVQVEVESNQTATANGR